MSALDSRKDRGGDRKSETAQISIASTDAIDEPGKSSEKTAELVGVSPRKSETNLPRLSRGEC